MAREAIRGVLLNDRTTFVAVNVVVNLLIIVRSYVAMRVLGYADLGLTALLQTIVLLVAALQFGVVNGAYRLVCSGSDEATRRVNNLVYTFIVALAVLLFVLGAVVAALPGERAQAHPAVLMLGIATGLFTILRTWITNYLIARVRLGSLNLLNAVAGVLSILPLAFVGVSPLPMCLLAIVLQPVVFVAQALLTERALRPSAPEWSRALIGQVMAAGFVVFLTSVFLALNAQLERWSIVSFLGLEGLGHFYLALLFLNLYTLVPTSFDAIFLPRLVAAYTAGDVARVRVDLRRFLHALLLYSAAVTAAVLLLAPPLLQLLMPRYLPDLRYVYLLLPGVVLFGLTAPLAMVFNVLIQYRFYFVAYGLGSLLTAGLLGGCALLSGTVSLDALSIIKSTVSVIMGGVIVVGYLTVSRSYPAFRFEPFRVRGASTA